MNIFEGNNSTWLFMGQNTRRQNSRLKRCIREKFKKIRPFSVWLSSKSHHFLEPLIFSDICTFSGIADFYIKFSILLVYFYYFFKKILKDNFSECKNCDRIWFHLIYQFINNRLYFLNEKWKKLNIITIKHFWNISYWDAKNDDFILSLKATTTENSRIKFLKINLKQFIIFE